MVVPALLQVPAVSTSVSLPSTSASPPSTSSTSPSSSASSMSSPPETASGTAAAIADLQAQLAAHQVSLTAHVEGVRALRAEAARREEEEAAMRREVRALRGTLSTGSVEQAREREREGERRAVEGEEGVEEDEFGEHRELEREQDADIERERKREGEDEQGEFKDVPFLPMESDTQRDASLQLQAEEEHERKEEREREFEREDVRERDREENILRQCAETPEPTEMDSPPTHPASAALLPALDSAPDWGAASTSGTGTEEAPDSSSPPSFDSPPTTDATITALTLPALATRLGALAAQLDAALRAHAKGDCRPGGEGGTAGGVVGESLKRDGEGRMRMRAWRMRRRERSCWRRCVRSWTRCAWSWHGRGRREAWVEVVERRVLLHTQPVGNGEVEGLQRRPGRGANQSDDDEGDEVEQEEEEGVDGDGDMDDSIRFERLELGDLRVSPTQTQVTAKVGVVLVGAGRKSLRPAGPAHQQLPAADDCPDCRWGANTGYFGCGGSVCLGHVRRSPRALDGWDGTPKFKNENGGAPGWVQNDHMYNTRQACGPAPAVDIVRINCRVAAGEESVWQS
ncbi:hypothetical protein B0H14DRAFT_2583890 [Mycena olivaceomarginata]|nr:hypothetical protein B0H14DRAFT_2583890 [Mycena olivaceomarginata]